VSFHPARRPLPENGEREVVVPETSALLFFEI
jgi:hypothetical protein